MTEKTNGDSSRRIVPGSHPTRPYALNKNQRADPAFVGRSQALTSSLDTVHAIAARKCAVVITGETGVGKEMVARQIHRSSDRADKVFIPVDCTTLTGQLFESQLFGHIRGAFTGAVDSTLGFFRAADGGTIFLDEISEIPIELQAKLLRVLQENAVTPLGSTKSFPVDVRVLSATNRDLRRMLEEGSFRADLFYRLNVVNLEVPPLRQRREDIMPLAEHFLANQAIFYSESPKALTPDARQLLTNYSWPGNVRELANAMERAYVLTIGREVQPAVLPFEVIVAESPEYPKRELPTLDQVKRKIITQTLKYTRGRKIAAAKILGIERRQLNRLIEKLNIPVKEETSNA
ncbi:MAG: sigma-54 interaction domain-containing protein [Planctomycetota bacterium]